MWLGVACCWTSLFGASYTTRLQLLVFLQGVLYAVGGALLYYPCISYMSEWFVRRRGLANGVIFAGTAAGGLVLPLILPLLISSQGPSRALRILSIVIVSLLVLILPLMKGRLPELRSSRARVPARRRYVEKNWSRNVKFWILLTANTFQGFGYFVPIVWLPTFATALKVDATNASIALALLNGASVIGRLSLGYLSDKFNPWSLALSTLLFTSMSTFILWGVLSHTFGGLVAFGVVYGLLAGGWSSLWTGFIRGVGVTQDDPIDSTTILGYLMFSRGIGNIVSTPISTALSTSNSSAPERHMDAHLGFDVDNGKYEKMILYVGTCFAGAAVVSLMGWVREKRHGQAGN
uniref:Putative monocarboxylate transporter 2 n=1 Tax=Moniliophthora roreri TaxID=221103 RepID=A0A0W0G9P2_MONRR